MKRAPLLSILLPLWFVFVGLGGNSHAIESGFDSYYRLKSSDPKAARHQLETYVKDNPSNSRAHTELAYELIGEKKYADAIKHLEIAQAAEPGNEQITLQLAYAYKAQSQGADARRRFQTLSQSTSTNVATTACQAVIDMAPNRFRFLPSPFFADAFLNPLYISRFNDTIFFSQFRAGAALGQRGQTEVYASLRYTDDNKSIGGAVPDIISDNAAVYAAGLRIRPFDRIPVSIYGEAGRARDLDERNRDRWRDDYRGGLIYFDRWAPVANCGTNWRFPFKRSSSLYGDLSIYSRYDNNWIGYLQYREGLRIVEKHRMAMDAFLYAGGAFDTNNIYYNNNAEIGAGASLSPDQSWPFFFRYTAVKGSYVNVGSPIGPEKDYTDHRWEAVGYVRF